MGARKRSAATRVSLAAKRTAPSAKARVLHIGDEPVAAHVQHVLGRVPATALLGALQAPVVQAIEVGKDAILVGEQTGHQRAPSPAAATTDAPATRARQLAAAIAGRAFLARWRALGLG